MGMPTEPIRDVMRRTIANLEFIEHHAGPNGPYEVTQLLNSFLGALAHPWEAMRNDLLALPLAEAADRGWPMIQKERPSDCDPESLGDLIRLMRNGFAHGNIELLPGKKGEIRALLVWNNNQSGRRTWGAMITVEAARKFLLCFVELIDELHERRGWYPQRA
jgi:hypothetical protein